MARYSRSRRRYSAPRTRRSYTRTPRRRTYSTRRRSSRTSGARTVRIVVQAASPMTGVTPQTSVVPLRAMF